MRKFTVLVVLATVIIIGIVAIVSKDTANASNPTASVVSQNPTKSDSLTSGTIDGAKNPEKIPDHVAYALLFDLIAGRETEAERNRIRAYLRQTGLGDSDANAMIAAAEEYQRRETVLAQQADRIKSRTHPNHQPLTIEEKSQLKQLQNQHRALVQGMVASLHYRLSTDGLSKVRQHVSERVKRKTKMSAELESQ